MPDRISQRHEREYVLTASSASIASILPCKALTKAMCAVSNFDFRSPALGSGGAISWTFSTIAMYSSRVEEIVWNVAVIFHGFVDMYNRGESAHRNRNNEQPLGQTKQYNEAAKCRKERHTVPPYGANTSK